MGVRFLVDRGGTFTDLVALRPDGTVATAKILSARPGAREDAVLAGLRLLLGLDEAAAIPPGAIEELRMGTTVATNALLERRGARTLLVVDAGFEDLLAIGDQTRPELFARDIRRPAPLHDAVLAVGGRIAADGTALMPLDAAATLAALRARSGEGFEACAIALAHAWRHPAGEHRVAALARAAGFGQVSLSHAVSPAIGLVARAETAVADAALSPPLRRYVRAIADALPASTPLRLMRSSGGLAAPDAFGGAEAVLSGPAGGVPGGVHAAASAGFSRVIGFDMGGTSTDIWLHEGSAFERRAETRIAGVALRLPMLAIDTIAAGGGSRLSVAGGRFRVGPESAGADPGPACYGNGGPAALTDANLLLGRLQPDLFPAIFGPEGAAPLDREASRAALAALAAAAGGAASPEEMAEGFLLVAVAEMSRAVRRIAIARGADPAHFALLPFGGAAGQVACLVAAELGMDAIVLHPLAGLLSAFGMGCADESAIREEAVERGFEDALLPALAAIADRLEAAAAAALGGAGGADLVAHRTVRLRRAGSDAALPVPLADEAAMRASFAERHRARFGYAPGDALLVEAVSVEVLRPARPPRLPAIPPRPRGEPIPDRGRGAFLLSGRRLEARVHLRSDLRAGDRIRGPAIVVEDGATVVVDPGWTGRVDGEGALVLRRDPAASGAASDPDRAATLAGSDPVAVALFGGLFMSIAESMGETLRATARSVNMRERRDFSCAVFDAEGRLVANAAHVPVHLGAMGESVRHVLAARAGGRLRPGDAFVLNHPAHGGTHLPDVTVVTPVFDADGLAFLVANRGHHVDIGGTTPGSTPPDSTTLAEEGVAIALFHAVGDGVFDEAGLRALLADAPHPARMPDTNLADLAAQVAANRLGATLLARAAERHGGGRLRDATRLVREHALAAMRDTIAGLRDGHHATALDDGTPVAVAVRIDAAARRATVDWTGTGGPHPRNFNAPRAVVRAVVLYAFRCLVADDLPLNDGALEAIDIVLPPRSILSPPEDAAVVAGNTEVSQVACVALLAALGVQASAQGTMNNLLFGDARLQYYETICGGAGAGPGHDGASAVHTHMTNTRITDPEILEWRFPVRVETFAIRRGSGGAGRHRGGDGARRALRFLAPMEVVLVASGRARGPFGLAGGAPGAPGRQWLERADGTSEVLPGVFRRPVSPGDLLVVETPGGGGYGAA